MRLLDRYLFRELLTPLVYCLGAFLIFWMAWNLFSDLDKLQAAKLHLLDVVEYSLAMIPEFLATILPVVLLLALLYTLTNHARHNEITAMRAAGISLWRIGAPYFAVGIFAGMVLFALNEFFVPRSSDWADRILNRYAPKQISAPQQEGFENGPANRTWFFRNFNFRNSELDGVTVSVSTNNWRLDADRAIYTNGAWTFYGVGISEFGRSAQTNVLAMPQFKESPREMKIELKIAEYERLNTRKTVVPLLDILNYLRLRPGASSPWLQTQLQEHLAAPFTCLVVVLIAIPFGAASGRRNLFFGVAGSIFICFAYIVIQKISLAVGLGGHLPGWLAAWLPNFVFGATGIFLTARVR